MKGKFYLLAIVVFLSSCGPTSKFIYTQDDDIAPAEVTFTNESTKAETYEWDFGDGNTSTEESPTHQFYLSGKYDVVLKAKKGKRTKKSKQELLVKAPEICLVLIETDFGNMVVELFDETPKHRDNFIKLAEQGFYNDLLFHRVIDGFMIQGGDPDSRNAKPGAALGTGDPGYQIDAEFNKKLVHVKGALAAARQGDASNPKRRSSGSQFYIVDGKPLSEKQIKDFELRNGVIYSEEQRKILLEEGGTPFLDMGYTVFGQVREGLEVIDAIAQVNKDGRDRPREDVKMKITVIK